MWAWLHFRTMSQSPQLGAGSGFVLPAEGETTLTWQNQSRQSYLLMTLGIVTPSFFFGGKTGPVSSLSCLKYSFRFPIYSLWLSMVGWCSYWWKPGQENDPGEYFFPCPLLLKKVQYVLVLEWLMWRGTMVQHRSEMLCWRQSYISWNSITRTPMDFSVAP